MKRVVLVAVGLLLFFCFVYLGKIILWPERFEKEIPSNIDVDLSLKGVVLSQGKDGKRLWNLNATSAKYAETTDELVLDLPCITYWGENSTDEMQVCAPKGLVWQKKDLAKMWDGVNASKGDYVLTSDTLDYVGSSKELVLLGSVHVAGKTMDAKANELVYSIENGNFTANGNVVVTLN